MAFAQTAFCRAAAALTALTVMGGGVLGSSYVRTTLFPKVSKPNATLVNIAIDVTRECSGSDLVITSAHRTGHAVNASGPRASIGGSNHNKLMPDGTGMALDFKAVDCKYSDQVKQTIRLWANKGKVICYNDEGHIHIDFGAAGTMNCQRWTGQKDTTALTIGSKFGSSPPSTSKRTRGAKPSIVDYARGFNGN